MRLYADGHFNRARVSHSQPPTSLCLLIAYTKKKMMMTKKKKKLVVKMNLSISSLFSQTSGAPKVTNFFIPASISVSLWLPTHASH